MADANLVTQEEMALRRRARRRLVGAVAIALTAFVVVPMLFDSEPKPLGPDVDLRIPAQDTPFEPAAPSAPVDAAALAGPEPSPQTAEPTVTAVPGAPQPAPQPVIETAPVAAMPQAKAPPAPAAKPESKAEPKPTVEPRPTSKTEPKPEAKVEPKPKVEPKSRTEPQAEAKPAPAKPDPAFASKGFYLQLGAFSSEANARQLQEKAQAAGFKVGMTGSNGQYRVRVGPIPEHAKALDTQARLKAKGFSPVLLGP